MTGSELRILAVDDERTQLADLARLLRASALVGAVDCAEDGDEALVKAANVRYDAIFLDVRMPGLDGVELARVLRRFAAPPQLVFVTAYETAAVEAFELHALDYLLKPVGRRRLEEALARVAAATSAEAPSGNGHPDPMADEVVGVMSSRGGAIRLLPRSSILYLQSYGDFVRVISDDGRYLMRETLSELERRWAAFGFVRVHRQYVANLRQVLEVRPQVGGTAELTFRDGQTIPVARRQVPDLSHRLGL